MISEMLKYLFYLQIISIHIHLVSSCEAKYHQKCITSCYDYIQTDITCTNTTITGTGLKTELKITGHSNYLSYTRNITFINSNVHSLSNSIFSRFHKLENLYINKTNVMDIETTSFHSLSNLVKLYLQDNNIQLLFPGTFKGLRNLTLLNMSNNQIPKLDEDLFIDLNKLEVLDLSYNQIIEININLFKHMYNLIELYCSNNKIDINIDFHEKLLYLDVSYTTLPLSISSFKNCSKLNELLLNNNNISFLDFNLFENLKELQNLQLNYNKIEKITTGTFRNLHNLKILNLSFNRLRYLEIGTINRLENIRVLNLSNNQLLDLEISEFYSLYYLETLNLDNNLLTTLDVQKLFLHMHRYNPEYIKISLFDNFWKCNWLPEAVGLLQKNNFIVLLGNSFNVENVRGIACVNNKSNSTSNFSFAQPAHLNTSTTNKVLPTTLSTKYKKVATRKPSTSTTLSSTVLNAINTEFETFSTMSTNMNTNNKYFEKFFDFYKAEERKLETTDRMENKTEEIWQTINELKSLLIFIVVAIISILAAAVLYFVQVKMIKSNNKKMEINDQMNSQSCNIELIDSNID